MKEEPIDRSRTDKYVCYSLPQDEKIAVQHFKHKYGYQPKEVLNWNGKYLLLGPVEESCEQDRYDKRTG